MHARTVAVLFALPLFFCSPQTAPVAPQTGASVAVLPPAVPTAEAAPLEPLLAARVDTARRAFADAAAKYASGQSTIDEIGAWSERLALAERETLTGKTLTEATRDRFQRLKTVESIAAQRSQTGAAPPAEIAKATYFRAGAEVELARSP